MPSIFISTAHENQDDEQVGTGDVDYAHTLAERLKELYQIYNGSEEVDCIQHLHDENTIYKYIEETKSKNPILHIMLNPPYTGSAFTLDGLLRFKERNNCKIIVTAIEFAKYDFYLKSKAFSYFNIANHIIFLDDKDKEQAEEFSKSKLSSMCSTSVIPVPATIPNIPGLKPSRERGNNILFFGMIRKAKGIGYLLQLAQLIQTNQENNLGSISDIMRDIKIIVVGSIQEHIYNNIFQLEKIILAMYPEKKEQIKQIININGHLSSEQIKNIIQRLKMELKSYEKQNLQKAVPIELYLDVPTDQLAVPFNKCKFSVLPLWRGGSIRNSSMTNMLVHDFITISFSGSATPEILIKGEYNGAMILLPQTNAVGQDVFANNVFKMLQASLENPELNKSTYDKMRSLSNNVLSIEIIIQGHVNLYSCVRNGITVTATATATAIDKDNISELDYYKSVYSKYCIQFIKTIRSDAANYYDKFVGAILGEHKEPLRRSRTNAEIYKVGIRNKQVKVLQADQTGKFLPPQFSVAEKQGKSKKMSLSVISSKQQYLTSMFGGNNEGRTTGIIFFTESGGESEKDKEIILPSLIFKKDAGTVGRTYYFENEEQAQDYIQNKGLYIAVQQLINAELETGVSCYNEVLGRLQWRPDDPRCHIGIFSNDLKSKLLAQLRAIDLQINTNAKYIPITFYDQYNKDSPFSGYLLEQRQADVEAGLLLPDYNVTKSMALLISKYIESQLSNCVTFSKEETEKCLKVLIIFKFTKRTIITFIKLICVHNNGCSDLNIIVCGFLCDELLALPIDDNSNFDIIIAVLEEIQTISDQIIINKLYSLVADSIIKLQQKSIELLEKILQKTPNLNQDAIGKLLKATSCFDNDDAKLNYLKIILEKITDLSLEDTEQFLETTYALNNEDAKLKYLEQLLHKITNLHLDIIDKLLNITYCFDDNYDAKLNYLERLLNKITDLNSDVIGKLLNITYCFDDNYDAKLNYLGRLLNKITDLNSDIIDKLLNITYCFGDNYDAKLNYLGQLLNKITDLNSDVINKLLKIIFCFEDNDVKLKYLEQLLNNKLIDIIDDNNIKILILYLYSLKFKFEDPMKIFNKFKSLTVLKAIEVIREECKTMTDNNPGKEALQSFLDKLSTNLTTRKREISPSLVFSSLSTEDNIEDTSPLLNHRKKMRHDCVE